MGALEYCYRAILWKVLRAHPRNSRNPRLKSLWLKPAAQIIDSHQAAVKRRDPLHVQPETLDVLVEVEHFLRRWDRRGIGGPRGVDNPPHPDPLLSAVTRS